MASLEELELAAEQTISAAASAIMWAGQDHHGVLLHVAGQRPTRLAKSRQSYVIMRAADAVDTTGFTAELNGVWVPMLAAAALPAAAVPEWSAAVLRARNDAVSVAYRWRTGRSVYRQSLYGLVRMHAVMVCGYWGEDPVPLRQIAMLSKVVQSQSGAVSPVDV